MGLAEEEALKCVHCGFCLEACPTYVVTRNEAYSPRGRITAFRLGLSLDPFESCMFCRRCEAACPSGVVYSRIYVEAIRRLKKANVVKVVENPNTLAVAVSVLRKKHGYIPKPQKPLEHRDENAEIVLFPGCVTSVLFRDQVEKALRFLKSRGFKVEVVNGCCGLAHLHSGKEERAKELVEELRKKAGGRPIVSLSSNCTAHMKENGLDAYDFAEFVVKKDLEVRGRQVLVTVHDPCHASLFGLGKYTREFLKRIGAKVSEMDEPNFECGAGGMTFILNPELSEEVAKVKKEKVLKANAEYVVSSNPVCTLSFLRMGLKPVHPVDLLE